MSDTHKIMKPEMAIEKKKMNPLVATMLQAGEGKIDVQLMKDMMDLQERWEKNEAKKEYNAAMISLKRDLPSFIEHDKLVDYPQKTGGRVIYTHTSLARAVTSIVPHLTQYDFSHSWIPRNDDKMVYVTCRLTHSGGHSEECSLSSPPDLSGGKSHSQGISSTITRLERYAFLALIGIATADMKERDHREPPTETINADKNLLAVAWMQRQGISVEQAVAHVRRGVNEWTSADLDTLRAWVDKRREKPPERTKPQPTADLSRDKAKLLEAARGFYGEDDAISGINRILSSAGTSFGQATDEQCRSATAIIDKEALG